MRHSTLAIFVCIGAGALTNPGAGPSFAGDLDNLIARRPGSLQSVLNPLNTKPLDPFDVNSFSSVNSNPGFLSLFQKDNGLSYSSVSSLNSGGLSFGANSEFRDTTRIDGSSFQGFVLGNNLKWQENQVGYANSTMNMGDTVRVTTRFGASTYGASDQFFNSLGNNSENARVSRFANVGVASGSASLTRVEEDVLRFGDSKVTAFQEFARVDRFFEDLKFSDKSQQAKTRDDV